MHKIYSILFISITNIVYSANAKDIKIYNPRQAAEWAIQSISNKQNNKDIDDIFYIPVLEKTIKLHVDSKYKDCIYNEIFHNIAIEYPQIKETDLYAIKYKAQQGKCANYVTPTNEEEYDAIYDLCMTNKLPAMQKLIYSTNKKDYYTDNNLSSFFESLPRMEIDSGWCDSYAQEFSTRILFQPNAPIFKPNVIQWYQKNEDALYTVNARAEYLIYKNRIFMAALKPEYKPLKDCSTLYEDNINEFISEADKLSVNRSEYAKAYDYYSMAFFNISDKMRCENNFQERRKLGQQAVELLNKWASVLRKEAKDIDEALTEKTKEIKNKKHPVTHYVYAKPSDSIRKDAEAKEKFAKEILSLIHNAQTLDTEIN